ncbi:MAG: helix-turn-helix transcriptional regulator [Acidobacteria bacterium]|nr:helix-turn-helix transcriptional regulator [Acidobacteriota bacterium]
MDNRIRVFREARGLSLDKLAALVGSTNQQISNLETGKRRLTADWLLRLGEALGCHPWALVADDLPQPLGLDEIRLLDSFRDLADAPRQAVLQLLESISPGRLERIEGG